MNILIIGNGFDLAHKLPTKYTDFLKFCNFIKKIYDSTLDMDKFINRFQNKEDQLIREICMNRSIIKTKGKFNKRNFVRKQIEISKEYDELYSNIKNNFWIKYFLQCNTYQKENWIDFETEISNVINSIDTDMKKEDFDKQITDLSNKYLKDHNLYKGYDSLFCDENGELQGRQEITFRQLRDFLLGDLNKFIRAFEIYLSEYVEKLDIRVISPDIIKILVKTYEKNGNKGCKFSRVLSFNYTNTYEKVYLNIYPIDCNKYIDYIHGKADINNTIESNNMVLGIDEYLPDERKNKDLEFIAFKKYYQRIYKQTGCKYKEWVDEIKADKSKKHNLFIFGHSLDITDKDILRDLILNDNVYTTIFYPDKEELGRKIANLVKVIGQDELIRRTGGSTKTIEFKLQQDMIKRESI